MELEGPDIQAHDEREKGGRNERCETDTEDETDSTNAKRYGMRLAE
jgi:hypothetical protein